MIIKTKRYELPKNTYIKVALINLLKQQWWIFIIPVAIACLAFVWPKYVWWLTITPFVLLGLYILFWAIQFTGVTQLEQNKIMFEKLSYEIDSRQFLIKLNAKQGSQIQWNQFKEAKMEKDHFLLVISKAQFFHLPFKIFNSDHDVKFMEAILKRKGFIK